MMMKRDLYGLFIPEIAVAIAEYGIESYRARQIAEWMYQRCKVSKSRLMGKLRSIY
ncbi:MAG: hypothetical protein K0Q75_836 [Anaerospora sp.]|nr:hypothetical protein [Anaerospora sp.]